MAYKICLDAGHYGKSNRSPVVQSYYESDMNWKLHNLLKKELEAYGFEVIQTRTSQDKDKELFARGSMSKGCDLFLSLHSNACDTESVDYPVAIVNLDGRGDKLGKSLADTMTKVMATRQAGRIYKRAGSNGSEYYGVLRGAASVGTMGIILEHSFHTNGRATAWLLKDANLEKMAKAEADALAAYFGVEKKPGVVYRVQVGAFTMKKNAESMLEDLKEAGFDGFIVEEEVAVPVVTNPRKTVDELAKEVIAGKWGSGEDRKKRLAEAGYDYSAVQKKVNELMK